MIKFSLSRILEESPYDLFLSGTDFRFITDFGIHYSVSFNKKEDNETSRGDKVTIYYPTCIIENE